MNQQDALILHSEMLADCKRLAPAEYDEVARCAGITLDAVRRRDEAVAASAWQGPYRCIGALEREVLEAEQKESNAMERLVKAIEGEFCNGP